MSLERVRIVGAGLIGTSIALGLSAKGVAVDLIDSDERTQNLARDIAQSTSLSTPQIVIFALPTEAMPLVINREYALNPQSTFMDVGSVKTEPIVHIKNSELPLTRFVPTHPMAGREIGGARSARGDLFVTRSWILTPTAECATESLELVGELIDTLGASAITLDAAEHDRAVATTSHLPQITASLTAMSLESAKEAWLELAGQGLRDTTRIAASDPALWAQIIYSNRNEISNVLYGVRNNLEQMLLALNDPSAIEALIAAGGRGRARIPGKHGGSAREYTFLPIVIDDKPGQLAAIFNECATIGVNVEDLSIEHSPGQLNALITLALSESDAMNLSTHLSSIGWNVHPVRK
ncbi:unannotated protein [freshwater metagenome]|uniref:Prephenate dehydrogenase n=1 Tax=freshwater metagenome TaxID=449393 RepID=A0A6J6ML63_9ZZZZ|nr:prephenate dehydrogenase [Actinomycetota bacterium]MSZ05722.1 prephenate dehydrogenase [Actinomycetota bacterium]